MKHRKTIGLVAFAIALLATYSAKAYVTLGYKWPSNSVTYDKHLLSTAWASAVWAGAYQWNAVTTSPFAWTAGDSGSNDVYLAYIDGAYGTYAVTYPYYTGSTYTSFVINFDTGETWYTGGGIPSSSQLDAIGVAAHEFGHGLGLNHSQWTNCVTNPKPTMCATYGYGRSDWRSLESDDRNGLTYLYP